MTRCIAFFALLAGLMFAHPAVAQEENFPPSKDDALSFNADERPIVSSKNALALDEESELPEEKKSGFPWISLPKPKLPSLPKPSMPKLSLPTWGSSTTTKTTPKARMTEEPSTWEKLSTGTKSLATKTKHTLMPWTADDEEARKKSPPTRRTARSTSTKTKSEKKPFFSSWLDSKPEEKEIRTVNDYLALPRVPYD